jgi:hypothetical protein
MLLFLAGVLAIPLGGFLFWCWCFVTGRAH